MKDEIKQLKDIVDKQQIKIDNLVEVVKQLSDSKLKTSSIEIINHNVQFLGKAYNKSGTLIPTINS